MPVKTRLAQITKSTATLIDNTHTHTHTHIYIYINLQRSFESYVIIDGISDHLPSLLIVMQTKKYTIRLEFTTRNLTEKRIARLNYELRHIDWTNTLQSNNTATEDYTIFSTEITKN